MTANKKPKRGSKWRRLAWRRGYSVADQILAAAPKPAKLVHSSPINPSLAS